MGNPSSLRFVPASQSATPINWTRIPEGAKKFFIRQYGYDWAPLPATIGDLAKMFDECKFFGYFEENLLMALMDINEFGLQPTSTPGQSIAQVGPRFYMNYTEEMRFLLFEPGTRECVVGYSDIIKKETYYEDEEMAQAAEEMAMAQAFDVALEQEVPRGMDEWAEFTKKLGGQWTVKKNQSKYTFADQWLRERDYRAKVTVSTTSLL